MDKSVLLLLLGLLLGSVSAFASKYQLTKPVSESQSYSVKVEDIQFLEHREEILGKTDAKTNVRVDLVSLIYQLSEGNDEVRQQLFAHSRAHNLFLVSKDADEAYNSYLYMTAIKYCLDSLGLGKEGAKNVLLILAQKQINTELRNLAAGRADRLLASGEYPPLAIFKDNSRYCHYTKPKQKLYLLEKDNQRE